MLWWARLPADSAPWLATISDPATLIPPPSVFVDVLPAILLFGAGISCVVAPLTTTLMGSVSGPLLRHRLGDQQLDLARRLTADGRHHLHRRQRHVLQRPGIAGAGPGHVVARRAVRVPATQPAAGRGDGRPRSPAQRQASIDAFHVAVLDQRRLCWWSARPCRSSGLREHAARGDRSSRPRSRPRRRLTVAR